MYSLYSFIYYPATAATVGHWSLTCPPQHSELVIAYLRGNKCKFNRKMQRTAWQKSVIQDRDIFTIEIISEKAVKSLIKATRDKGGLVIEPQVVESQIEPLTESIESTNDIQVDVCVRYDSFSDDNVLKITISGDVPDLCDIPGLDEQLICEIAPILKSNLRLVCYYPQEQKRASKNVTRVLKILGFYESDGCLLCDF